jgi:hypothetical protein
MVTAVTETAAAVNWNTATVVLQLFDNSVYLVSKPGGEKLLPRKDRSGTFHIEGNLMVADKPAVKNLALQLTPLLKVLGESRKIFLTPLARYWVGPCCTNPVHHTNYRSPGYLPALGDAVHALRDSIRDSLFTRRTQNFRVLCPNKMIGVGQRSQAPSDEEAARTAAMWGSNPVHPSAAAYRCMAEHLEKDVLNIEARYTNPGKQQTLKKPRIDLSLGRADWVMGCSAAASRRDMMPGTSSAADAGPSARAGRAGLNRAVYRGQSLRGSTRSLKRGSSSRGGRGRRGWGRGGWGSF